MPNKWTDNQKIAINTRARDVLVTASAGTGKTAVLAERCVEILTDKNDPIDVSQVLVLTFADDAAEEMRSRIAQRLRARLLENYTPSLSAQFLGLDAAQISTIHSFCKRVILDHFYLLDIDPAFRIIDDDEQKLLKLEVLEKVIEQAWTEEPIAAGLQKLFYRRNVYDIVKGYISNVINISDFLDSVVSKQHWFDRAAALSDMAAADTSELAQQQKEIVLAKLLQCKEQLSHSILLDKRSSMPYQWTQQIKDDILKPVNDCIKKIKAGDLKGCIKIIRTFEKPRFNTKPRDMDKDEAEFVRQPAKKAIETFQSLLDLALVNPEYEKLIGSQAGLQTKILLELVKRFIRAYDQAKKKINTLDFADLQRLMLQLLSENEDVAERLKEKFKCIFVDEYQDINALQQAIIDKIRRTDNVFVVGDVKQSIYAFRQGKPELFLDMLKGASDKPGKQDGSLKVGLSDNFRSRKGVLDFANTVFNRIMRASVSLIDYNEETFLKEGFNYKPIDQVTSDSSPLVEIHIADEQPADNDNDEEDAAGPDTTAISSAQRQATFIAERIKQMVGDGKNKPQLKIYDKNTDTYRDVNYGDIVILMRSPAKTANEYVEVLRLAGIPVSSRSSAGYFAAAEITDCVSLLKVLDNPQRDIELAAVLRSPLFKITDTELAMIKQFAAEDESLKNYYDHVCNYSKQGKNKQLKEKLAAALINIEQWRSSITRGSIADTLWAIFRQTGFLSFVSALPNGRQRRANLLKMHDRAIQFEGFAAATAAGSLTRFVEFIEKLLDQDQDWAPARPDDDSAQAVRIMSIHKSKGLEFGVVFLAQLNKKFNFTDIRGDCITDDTNTLGVKVIDPDTKTKFTSIAHEVIAEKKKDSTLAEEMRLLYVAMTRAREKLIICASKKKTDCARIVKQVQALDGEPVRTWQLKNAACALDWLLLSLGDQKQLQDLFDPDGTAASVEHELFTASLLDLDKLSKKAESILHSKGTQKIDLDKIPPEAALAGRAMLTEISRNLSWQYPFAELTRIAAKTSVSELTHGSDEYASLNLGNVFERTPKAVLRAQGIAGEKVEGKLIGTATHLVISELDLNDISPDAVGKLIHRLTNEGRIPLHVADKIGHEAILGFFKSDLGKLVLSSRDRVLCEWEFTFGYDNDLPDQYKGTENVIVQGI
ncbi:MAG: helicase-exonuclease AddAB subunit AddA, partial [Sedimentisphaerales bacterium]|nr:helicase-exonuclease AddAB subunit AddA [Sedimentisphaerales bacterium]